MNGICENLSEPLRWHFELNNSHPATPDKQPMCQRCTYGRRYRCMLFNYCINTITYIQNGDVIQQAELCTPYVLSFAASKLLCFKAIKE